MKQARQILKNAGCNWDASGSLVDPRGGKMPALKTLVGAGCTDFISMAQIISQNLNEIGLEMVIDQEPWYELYTIAPSARSPQDSTGARRRRTTPGSSTRRSTPAQAAYPSPAAA